MPKINILSFEVANLIAAGEVVDRPSSAVKELMENSLDAGATMITVEIKRGGVSFIRISDNGCGISREDLPSAILRHATSKIVSAEDLSGIATLGFRGEALAAIAAVSKLRIFSKQPTDAVGSLMEAEGGEITGLSDVNCNDGTTIIVEDLFCNVPARRKFLKKDATESTAVGAAVEKIALSHPEVSVRYICDSEVKFVTSGKGDLQETIWALFGKDSARRSLKCDREENGIRVSGYVCEPDLCRSNRSMENFFINGRYIKSKTASAAVEQAYSSKIPADKFPFCVLNITLNPAAVDVNVHPAKLEVKFANEKLIFDAVYYAVLSALESDAKRPELALPQTVTPYASASHPIPQTGSRSGNVSLKNAFIPQDQRKTRSEQLRLTDEVPPEGEASPLNNLIRAVRDANSYGANSPAMNVSTPAVPKTEMPIHHEPEWTVPDAAIPTKMTEPIAPTPPASVLSTVPDARTAESSPLPEAEIGEQESKPAVYVPDEILPGDIPEYQIIGEAFNCYVIVQLYDRLLLIDKHAAHERIIFDELSRKMRKNLAECTKSGQMVLVPLQITMLPGEVEALESYRDKVEALGFDFTYERSAAAQWTVFLRQIPEQLDNLASLELFSTLGIRLANRTTTVEAAAEGFFESRLWQASCKAAIKGGRIYDMGHIKWICDRLLTKPDKKNQVIRTCPHGRPVAFEIKKTSIDRQFARLG